MNNYFRIENVRKFLIVFCEVVVVLWVTLNPSSGKILCNNCIPLLVPRFSFFIEELVVGFKDITKLGRAEYVAFELRLQVALVICVRLQISQLASLGEC